MPSGHAHDAITVLLAAPVAVATFAFTRDLTTAAIVGAAFIFAGVMFGPDLDTKSKQYSRWGPFRAIWLPYRTIFPHRSRWSHGLIFGTLFRGIYFLGVATLVSFASFTAYGYFAGDSIPGFANFVRGWALVGRMSGSNSTLELMSAILAGMWAGAASHTVTDTAVTYIKTGRMSALF